MGFETLKVSRCASGRSAIVQLPCNECSTSKSSKQPCIQAEPSYLANLGAMSFMYVTAETQMLQGATLHPKEQTWALGTLAAGKVDTPLGLDFQLLLVHQHGHF